MFNNFNFLLRYDTQLTKESFEGNNKKVLYMTGLPSYMALIALFDIIQPHLSPF
ncbi:hypothetical protein LSH36_1095g00086 [Paralvinella palmiformis]|uniref:Uncharacterized protein n=1 Tax=Paralvinella palmiformis TaxID=53620 RepID=A0AAD9IV14_9ANNE|nr:hypothetical protein LSH36_1095g00086 [Paralvinella palmiformis]